MKLPSLEASGWQRKETRSPSFTQNSALSVDIFFQCLSTDFVMQAELLLMFFYFIALLVKLKAQHALFEHFPMI